jgi:hypothetical protein
MFPSVFYRELKIFTGNATITDVFTDGTIPLVFYRELRNIYYKCHNHRCLHKRIHSVDISLRVEKYLLHMPLSPTKYFHWYISSGNFFFDAYFLSVKPLVFFLSTECGIIDGRYANRCILLGIYLVKYLPIKW